MTYLTYQTIPYHAMLDKLTFLAYQTIPYISYYAMLDKLTYLGAATFGVAIFGLLPRETEDLPVNCKF